MQSTEDKLFNLLCESENMDWDRKVEHLVAAGVAIPVRCGECRHWVPEDSRKDYGVCHRFGNKRGIWRRADGYCDKGERGDCRRGREEGTERVS